MAPFTRESFQKFKSSYERLLLKAKRFNSTDPVSNIIVNQSISLLESFSPKDEKDQLDSAMIMEELQDSLPCSSEIFHRQLFSQPLTPIVLLHEIAKLYNFDTIDPNFLKSVQLSSEDLQDRKVIMFTWLGYFKECSANTVKGIVDRFKNSRGTIGFPITESQQNPEGHINTEPKPGQFPGNNSIANEMPTGAQQMFGSNLASSSQRPTHEFEIAGGKIQRHIHNQDPEHDSMGNVPNPRFSKLGPYGHSPNAGEQKKFDHSNNPKASALYTYENNGSDIFIDEYGNKFLKVDQNNGKPDTTMHLSEHSKNSKNAGYIAQIFKDSQFCGELEQSIEQTLTFYKIVSKQYNLDNFQMVDYFIHALGGPAKIFYINKSSSQMCFEDVEKLMKDEYNSDARQIQVKGQLDTLKLQKYMEENSIKDVSTGLTKIVELIENLVPQCQPDFRTESHKIHYLKQAVSEFSDWSLAPIQAITTHKYNFTAFKTALHEAYQNYSEIRRCRTNSSDTFLAQYGRDPRSLKTRFNNGKNPKQGKFPKHKSCYRCGEKWFPNHRCNSGSIEQHFKQRIRNGEKATYIIGELIKSMESDTFCVQEGEETNSELDELNSVLNDQCDESNEEEQDHDPEHNHITNFISSSMNTFQNGSKDF